MNPKEWEAARDQFFSKVPRAFRMMTNDRRVCQFVRHALSSSKYAVVMFPNGTTETLGFSEVEFTPCAWIN